MHRIQRLYVDQAIAGNQWIASENTSSGKDVVRFTYLESRVYEVSKNINVGRQVPILMAVS